MLGVVGVLTVEAQGKGPWWEIPGKVLLHPYFSCVIDVFKALVGSASNWRAFSEHILTCLDGSIPAQCLIIFP